MCPRNRAPSCPLQSVGVGRRGYSELEGRLQRNYRTVIFFPLTCPTLHRPLSELPSPFCVSIPSLVCVLSLFGSLSSPLSRCLSLGLCPPLSVSAAPVCTFSLWVSFPLLRLCLFSLGSCLPSYLSLPRLSPLSLDLRPVDSISPFFVYLCLGISSPSLPSRPARSFPGPQVS